MGLKVLTPELGEKMRRRGLIIGGPNSLKTTSILRTAEKPIHVISYPGEKGSGVIPTDDPGIKPYIWEDDDQSKVSITQQIEEIERFTWDILAGKHGEIKTFFGDGLHKLASLYWNKEFADLILKNEQALANNKVTENDLQLRAYGNENYGATKKIMSYITRVAQSNIHTVIFSCWEGAESGQFGNKDLDENKAPHIFADLPGRLARRIVGEFGVVLYAEVGLPDPKGNITGEWQIRKMGKVWGVGVKVPPWIAAGLPAKVPMDWIKLQELLSVKNKEELVKLVAALPKRV